jgi:virginiamycin A acetyltransferase
MKQKLKIYQIWDRFFRSEKTPILLALRSDLAMFEIGRCSYGGLKVIKWSKNGNLQIGNFCSFAENTVVLLGGEHDTTNITTYPLGVFIGGVALDAHEKTKGNVVIGNDVWIGRNSTILSGVTIGDGAVVGACSLVTKNVEPYSIVAGNPAQLIRKRFKQNEIDALQKIKWWTWPDEKIKASAAKLLGGDIESFIKMEIDKC